jgi:hypothetical protein|tara:strand:- start:214 stop:435 length:222 start_codon:yes stop_codon:yes gene_type:complete
MGNAEEKLADYFDKLMIIAKNSSKNSQDSILLAGAMMAVSRVLIYDHLSLEEANALLDQGGLDLIELVKPTIH